jgi:hypothetical protein
MAAALAEDLPASADPLGPVPRGLSDIVRAMTAIR